MIILSLGVYGIGHIHPDDPVFKGSRKVYGTLLVLNSKSYRWVAEDESVWCNQIFFMNEHGVFIRWAENTGFSVWYRFDITALT